MRLPRTLRPTRNCQAAGTAVVSWSAAGDVVWRRMAGRGQLLAQGLTLQIANKRLSSLFQGLLGLALLENL